MENKKIIKFSFILLYIIFLGCSFSIERFDFILFALVVLPFSTIVNSELAEHFKYLTLLQKLFIFIPIFNLLFNYYLDIKAEKEYKKILYKFGKSEEDTTAILMTLQFVDSIEEKIEINNDLLVLKLLEEKLKRKSYRNILQAISNRKRLYICNIKTKIVDNKLIVKFSLIDVVRALNTNC